MTKTQSESTSIFGKLKSFVVEEVPESPAATPAVVPVRAAPVQSVAPASDVATEGDPEVRKILEKDVQAAAHPAYSQFITLTDSMSAVIPDETVRFKAALAALRPQGFELDAVLKDIDECLHALDLKEAEAEKAAAAAETQRVGAKMKQMSELETRRAELQVELEQVLSSIEKIRVQVERDSANIRSTREKFAATVSAYKQELLERRKKIHMSAGGFGRV